MSLGGSDVGQEKNGPARRFALGLGLGLGLRLSRGKLCKLVKSFSGFELAASSVTDWPPHSLCRAIQKTVELFSSFKFGSELIKLQVANWMQNYKSIEKREKCQEH